MRVTLITGRTLGQGQGKEIGKTSEKYKQSVAVCEIDPKDLEKLQIESGTSVKVSTNSGSVVVKGIKSTQPPHPGLIFIPYGPWASTIMESNTGGTGMPSMKGLKAEIEPVPDQPVLGIKQLLKEQYGV
jgi:formylmethanofuran dehydrogenase subunit D